MKKNFKFLVLFFNIYIIKIPRISIVKIDCKYGGNNPILSIKILVKLEQIYIILLKIKLIEPALVCCIPVICTISFTKIILAEIAKPMVTKHFAKSINILFISFLFFIIVSVATSARRNPIVP